MTRYAALLMLLCWALPVSSAWSQELTDRQRAELVLAMRAALEQCNQTLATCRQTTREVIREVIREIPAECPELPPETSPWPDRMIGAGVGAGVGATLALLAVLLLR